MVAFLLLGFYVTAFFAYRWWAYDTAGSRPHGVPAWYFVYPTETPAQRIAHWLFFPCIRLDQIVQDAKSPNA